MLYATRMASLADRITARNKKITDPRRAAAQAHAVAMPSTVAKQRKPKATAGWKAVPTLRKGASLSEGRAFNEAQNARQTLAVARARKRAAETR